jgi:hypothetical protein
MLQKIKDNFQFIVLGFLVIIFLRQCGVNKDIDRIEKESKAISAQIDSVNTLSKPEIRKEMRQVMFEFLIYEDDFDKKKISLSEIKNRLEDSEK